MVSWVAAISSAIVSSSSSSNSNTGESSRAEYDVVYSVHAVLKLPDTPPLLAAAVSDNVRVRMAQCGSVCTLPLTLQLPTQAVGPPSTAPDLSEAQQVSTWC